MAIFAKINYCFMGIGDRVKEKNNPNSLIWKIQEIKGEYATCIVEDYYLMQIKTFPLEDLILV